MERSNMACSSYFRFREVRDFGRCSVHVGYYVSLLVVITESNTGIVRVRGGVNEVVAIE